MAMTAPEIEKHIIEQRDAATYWFRYLTGGALAVFGTLVIYIWRKFENRLSAHTKWREGFVEKGGVVTGDKLTVTIKEVVEELKKNCKENRVECQEEWCRRITDIETWRKDMADAGGPMLRSEHLVAYEKQLTRMDEVSKTQMKMIDTMFTHHREWVQKGLENIQLTIENDVLEQLKDLKILMGKQ